MKSCLSLLITFFAFVSIVCGGGMLWYISNTATFSRVDHLKKPPSLPAPALNTTTPSAPAVGSDGAAQ